MSQYDNITQHSIILEQFVQSSKEINKRLFVLSSITHTMCDFVVNIMHCLFCNNICALVILINDVYAIGNEIVLYR